MGDQKHDAYKRPNNVQKEETKKQKKNNDINENENKIIMDKISDMLLNRISINKSIQIRMDNMHRNRIRDIKINRINDMNQYENNIKVRDVKSSNNNILRMRPFIINSKECQHLNH